MSAAGLTQETVRCKRKGMKKDLKRKEAYLVVFISHKIALKNSEHLLNR